MKELAPLRGRALVVRRVAVRGVYQLQHERPARADVRPAGQEVPADQGLEDARFAAALRTHDGDLWELELAAERVDASLAEDVLQLVYERHEAIAQGVLVVRSGHRERRGAKARAGARVEEWKRLRLFMASRKKTFPRNRTCQMSGFRKRTRSVNPRIARLGSRIS